MKKLITPFKEKVARFLDDEEGFTSIEVIMLIAISAVIVAAIFTLGKQIIFPWAVKMVNKLIGKTDEDE